MDQRRAPLLAALEAYAEQNPARFHVPGHKGGRWVDEAWRSVAAGMLPWDLTEVPGLDDLFAPDGPIAEAQALAAALAGAAASFFLVGGTTAGIEALMLATAAGRQVLVPRNAHRSVLSGLILADSDPVWIPAAHDPELGISLTLSPADVAAACRQHPTAAALWVTCPTYEGLAQPLRPLAEAAGLPLIVDEAHGAHFPFAASMPTPALRQGAMAVVQSLHKTGGSATQSSLLHLAAGFPAQNALRDCLRLVQSSSPSYWLMASLDAARRNLGLRGAADWAQAVALAEAARAALGQLPGIVCPDMAWAEERGCKLDPTRLLIDVGHRGLTGHQGANLLRQHGVGVELAGYRHVLAIVTPGDDQASIQALIQAVAALPAGRAKLPPVPAFPALPQVACRPRQAFFAPREYIPLAAAPGRVAAEWVAPYPPGIPIIVPGEIWTHDAAHYLTMVRAHGWHVQGGQDDAAYVAVLKE